MNWEEIGYRIAQEVLPNGFEIYDFRVLRSKRHVDIQIRLDNHESPLNSPTLAECASFSRSYRSRLDKAIQNHQRDNPGAFHGNYTLEVSSPGVYREIRLPDDLERFQEHPMKVRYRGKNKDIELSEVLQFVELGKDGKLIWKMADTRFNQRQGKIKKRSARSRSADTGLNIEIYLNDIKKVNLFADV